jgi:1-acyl-sn-glycerol-3-phosphate acyltransferase
MKREQNAAGEKDTMREYRAYKRLYRFLRTVLFLFIRIRYTGRENLPEGAAMLCANHSSNLDPIVMSMGMSMKIHPHYMAKVELFKIPLLAQVLRAIGTITVNRQQKDIAAIKTAMKYLKAGEKVGIFPEGTRVRTDDGGDAKRGAVQIADQMSAPVVPIYITRKKRVFGVCRIVIGKPYFVNPERRKLSAGDYQLLADGLMEKIMALQPECERT